MQNFLDLDDLWVTEEGELVHMQSIIRLSLGSDRCVLPTTEGARVDFAVHVCPRGSSHRGRRGNTSALIVPTRG
jgi:hypothetical protein